MYKRKPRYFSFFIILIIVFFFLNCFSSTSLNISNIGEKMQRITNSNDYEILNRPDNPGVGLSAATLNIEDEIYSTHAILVDLDRNKIIFDKAIEETTYPASLTKIMTVLVAIENTSNLNQEVLLPQNMFNDLYEEGASMAGYLPGEKVQVIDLLYAAILPSGSEAAEGLAMTVAGSEAEFVDLMNKKSEELNMANSHFENSTGLDDPNHYTTVYDMALLLKYALKNEIFRSIFTSQAYSTSDTNLHPDGITFNSTMFESLNSVEYNGYEILGGKTGYTDTAGLCLCSIAKKNDKEYLLITTGAPGNHESNQYNIIDAITIYNNI